MYIYSFLALLVVWNVIVFFLYGLDKTKSRRGKWRISEATLILCAIFMGGIGALCGMYVFRHKTRHLKFKLGVPIALGVNAFLIAGLFLLK